MEDRQLHDRPGPLYHAAAVDEGYAHHTPKKVDTPDEGTSDITTLQMIEEAFTSHSPPTDVNEVDQWRAAGWIDPAEWNTDPMEEQKQEWREKGWLSQEYIEGRYQWPLAGWRFD